MTRLLPGGARGLLVLAGLLAAVWLGCGSEGPDPSVGCALVEERWESGGQLRVVGCRRVAAAPDAASGGHALELELDLELLADTQIFPRGPLVHKSGPQGSGHQHPAGEVVSVREDIVLVESADGWTEP